MIIIFKMWSFLIKIKNVICLVITWIIHWIFIRFFILVRMGRFSILLSLRFLAVFLFLIHGCQPRWIRGSSPLFGCHLREMLVGKRMGNAEIVASCCSAALEVVSVNRSSIFSSIFPVWSALLSWLIEAQQGKG